jgi:hypothetical protein
MKNIENLILSYKEKIELADTILLINKGNKSLARKHNDQEMSNILERDRIHHSAERQMLIQFIADLESLPEYEKYLDKKESSIISKAGMTDEAYAFCKSYWDNLSMIAKCEKAEDLGIYDEFLNKPVECFDEFSDVAKLKIRKSL